MSHIQVVETRTKTCHILGLILEKGMELLDSPESHEKPKPREEENTTINVEGI